VEASILSAHIENYDFVDARKIVKDLAIELRTDKACDVVIVAIHGDDDGLNAALASYDGDAKIDAIFTGHSHTPTDEEIVRADGSRVCVLQNGGYGDSFASLTLEFDEDGSLKDTNGVLHDTDIFIGEGILSPVFEKYKEQMAVGETVLLTIDEAVSRYDVGISVVYSMYAKYNADFAVVNGGGVRTSISAGDVTYADIFQILPFENEVYIVTLSGADLKSYLNTNIGGIYYWGININSLEDDLEYRMAIVDFVYLGYTFDDYRNDSCIDTNDLIRDVFIEHIKASV
jgi:2',3'-cyclic-nucleotide 2'-phosphodiesterase (5'-nucleotidase family)